MKFRAGRVQSTSDDTIIYRLVTNALICYDYFYDNKLLGNWHIFSQLLCKPISGMLYKRTGLLKVTKDGACDQI